MLSGNLDLPSVGGPGGAVGGVDPFVRHTCLPGWLAACTELPAALSLPLVLHW
jgi:hypothetical protein